MESGLERCERTVAVRHDRWPGASPCRGRPMVRSGPRRVAAAHDVPDRAARRARRPARHAPCRAAPAVPAAASGGPGQADRHGHVRRRHRRARAPGTAPRSARPTRTPASIALELDPAFDWSTVVRRDRGRHPGREHRELDQGRPADPRADRRRDPAPRRAAGPPRRARPGDPARRAPRVQAAHRRRSPRSSTRSSPTTSSPSYTIEAAATSRRPSRAADLVLEGEYRVGHQEQLYIENNAMIAVPRDDGGVAVTGSLQCPYYVHTALKRGLGLDDQAGPGRSRPRPAAGSVARRSSPRSSGCTPRSSRSRPSSRSA